MSIVLHFDQVKKLSVRDVGPTNIRVLPLLAVNPGVWFFPRDREPVGNDQIGAEAAQQTYIHGLNDVRAQNRGQQLIFPMIYLQGGQLLK